MSNTFKKVFLSCFAAILLTGCAGSKSGTQDSANEVTKYIADFEKDSADRVFFAFNSAELTEQAKETLKSQIRWLNIHDDMFPSVIIEGHCDERGTREYNMALGAKRAEAVKTFLIAEGFSPNRIAETVSYGKERPAVIGNNEKAWSKNRRGVTSIRGSFQ